MAPRHQLYGLDDFFNVDLHEVLGLRVQDKLRTSVHEKNERERGLEEHGPAREAIRSYQKPAGWLFAG